MKTLEQLGISPAPWRGGLLTSKCYSRWPQMPYEEGVAE